MKKLVLSILVCSFTTLLGLCLCFEAKAQYPFPVPVPPFESDDYATGYRAGYFDAYAIQRQIINELPKPTDWSVFYHKVSTDQRAIGLTNHANDMYNLHKNGLPAIADYWRGYKDGVPVGLYIDHNPTPPIDSGSHF